MKTLIATLLATAVSVSFAQAPDAKPDPSAYRNLTQKAAADYKAAEKNCKSMSGNAKTVCIEEAKVARARTEQEAVAQYNNTGKASIDSRTKLANAEFSLAKARCATSSGTEKDSCINNAKSVHTAALADAKLNVTSSTTASTAAPVTTADTSDATKAAAVEKCAQVAGQPSTGCLIDNRTATTTATAVDKTKAAAATVADKTERAVDTVAAKTERAADTVAAKSERAAEKTGAVVADSVITTKVKADIFKEPELKSMAIHVETEKGVVMLSGFVDSKADAEKAASIARSVEGVTQVKSAIKVK
jgi:hyperosmotically inducible protein